MERMTLCLAQVDDFMPIKRDYLKMASACAMHKAEILFHYFLWCH